MIKAVSIVALAVLAATATASAPMEAPDTLPLEAHFFCREGQPVGMEITAKHAGTWRIRFRGNPCPPEVPTAPRRDGTMRPLRHPV